MRLPRFRLKLWMLVMLVALVAIGFGAERTVRRVGGERAIVAVYAKQEAFSRDRLVYLEKQLAWWREEAEFWRDRNLQVARQIERDIATWTRGAASWRRRLEYYSRMRQKHERACRFPWPSVPPDPPVPESPKLKFPTTERPKLLIAAARPTAAPDPPLPEAE